MKSQFKYTPLALAVSALLGSPLAFADSHGDPHHNFYADVKVNARANLELDVITYKNNADVSIEKDIKVKKDILIRGGPTVRGIVRTDAVSMAIVDDKQINDHNWVGNNIVDNDAHVGGNALQNAAGNIGLNVTAGDNNLQDNSAALSAVDAAFVFADAEVFSFQQNEWNHTSNWATRNSATLDGNALQNAAGNIGVNISAGNSNLQKNDLAASVNSSGTMAEATVWAKQEADHNTTSNNGAFFEVQETTQVTLNGNLGGSYFGFGFGGYAGSESGTTQGTADQINDLYLDTWDGPLPHPSGSSTGHIDLDSAVQNAVDLNGDGGALAFNEQGSYSGSANGNLAFFEFGNVGLSGVFTGSVNNSHTVFRPHVNDASIGGNALRGAAGNIGVNIAAGTNNIQGNHLAIAAATGGNGGGGGGGGE
jgi:hypothetical protein